MKKLIYSVLGAAVLLCASTACNNDEQSTWDKYEDWRAENLEWVTALQNKKNADGTAYYRTIVPSWNNASFILIHYFNDRNETEGNLSPLYTSNTDTRYELHNCRGEKCDSSSELTANGPGIFRSRPNANIQGWAAALMDMRCGDTAEIIIPYGLGYGSQNISTKLPPYSCLRFNVRLVDIPNYETVP